MRNIIFLILVYSLNYAQNKPFVTYESKYYVNKTDENFILNSYKSTLNIDDKFNFSLIVKMNTECTFTDNHKYDGICKLKKDTLILITAVPNKFIEKISDSLINPKTFIYSIRNFSTTKVDSYIENLNFYFIDDKMNLKQTRPIKTQTKFNLRDTESKENKNEIIVTFEIPENCLFFTKKDKNEWNNVTLCINDIKGKIFTLAKDYQNLGKKYNPEIGESYYDLTLRKYILKRKLTKLKIIKQKQYYEDDLFLKK